MNQTIINRVLFAKGRLERDLPMAYIRAHSCDPWALLEAILSAGMFPTEVRDEGVLLGYMVSLRSGRLLAEKSAGGLPE